MTSTIWTTPRDDAHWLAMRSEVISSTESASLFPIPADLRPSYLHTPYRLWHEKRNSLPSNFKETPRTRRGKHLEWAIAQEIAAEHGWEVKPFKDYARLPDVRMGASFDAVVICPERGEGLMECKLVDWWIYQKAWLEDEAPPHIEIQVQHQLEVADRWDWACIAVWCGSEPKWLILERDREAGKAIREAVNEFWSWNSAPDPDYLVDAQTIREVFSHVSTDEVDLSHDPEIAELCECYLEASREVSAAVNDKTIAMSELIMKIGAAKKVTAGGYKITSFSVDEQEISFTRKGYRGLRITQRKMDI